MKFRNSTCKIDCGGHRAGYNYALRGGRKPSKYSRSFNQGMKIGIKAAKQRVKRKKRVK